MYLMDTFFLRAKFIHICFFPVAASCSICSAASWRDLETSKNFSKYQSNLHLPQQADYDMWYAAAGLSWTHFALLFCHTFFCIALETLQYIIYHFAGDLHGQLEDLLLIFYKVSTCKSSYWQKGMFILINTFKLICPEWFAVLWETVCLQWRLCGSW